MTWHSTKLTIDIANKKGITNNIEDNSNIYSLLIKALMTIILFLIIIMYTFKVISLNINYLLDLVKQVYLYF